MDSETHYTVFIKLPFPRESFEDPPPVHWNAAKDQQLWKAISRASSSRELNWDELRTAFDVPLSFLLQQAAWLYERHFESMKAQMKRLSVTSANAAGSGTGTGSVTPLPEGEALAKGASMMRTGSGDRKAPPATSTSKAGSVLQRDTTASPGTPRANKPAISRTASNNTVTQSRIFGSARHSSRQIGGSGYRRGSPSRNVDSETASRFDDPNGEPESEGEPTWPTSPSFRGPSSINRMQSGALSSDGDAEDEDADSSEGFLPFATSTKQQSPNDPNATVRNSPRKQSAPANKSPPPSSSVSSASSTQPQPVVYNTDARPGPLSPKQKATLQTLSPRYRRSGSEDSPSIGSSFSDLDDASITQSAMGEAFLSNMQHGGSMGMGSRMSTLREALGKGRESK